MGYEAAVTDTIQISAARSSISRQYILITPNAIEGRASLDRDVKVTRYVGREIPSLYLLRETNKLLQIDRPSSKATCRPLDTGPVHFAVTM